LRQAASVARLSPERHNVDKLLEHWNDAFQFRPLRPIRILNGSPASSEHFTFVEDPAMNASMTSDEYLSDRLEDQIKWYDAKSQWNQLWYKRLRLVEFVFASLIPFLVTQIKTDASPLTLVVGSMGVCIAVISSLVSLYKFQENWIEYRTTAEALKREKYLYLTQSHPYDSDDGFRSLVDRIESLLSRENTNWARNTKAKAQAKKND
jgi:hypothetical protein